MTPASLNEIYKAIGTLTAEVAGLRRDIQEADVEARESGARADQHRATLHRRMDELVGEIGDLNVELVQVKNDVKDAKGVTDDVKRWKLMGIGALFVTGIAASAIGSVVTYLWSDIGRWFRGM